ncbi:MAG: 50S ribosomal protein L15 [Candidatus Eiseniibacteriota bacterium]|nr:MAG: 50S ribosomal protein L15 [Candidatus Eisenbacteria bacterium]
MSKLNQLRPAAGSRKKRKRLGCGEGSGHGGTSTKGHKGLKCRSGGKVPAWFEGGQMPLQRRIPKRGFTNPTRVEYQVVNLGQLSKLDSGAEVTPESLFEKRLVHKRKRPIKILGAGEISIPLKIKVHAVSKSAKERVEQAGGSVELIK